MTALAQLSWNNKYPADSDFSDFLPIGPMNTTTQTFDDASNVHDLETAAAPQLFDDASNVHDLETAPFPTSTRYWQGKLYKPVTELLTYSGCTK